MDERYKIIGESPVIQMIKEEIEIVGPANFNVVITGETGTGKELVARNLHYNSGRRDGPFVAINCAGITESLLESELFGHVEGSFTGSRRGGAAGKLEQAHSGTLFLDEVGLMTERVQMALLRSLQLKEVTRVGGQGTVKTDFRLITATNIDLEDAVAKGRFREDLYHRIFEDSFHVPPLRERKEDIPILLKHFCEMYCRSRQMKIIYFEPKAVGLLQTYDWPGNVRELENLVKRCISRVKERYVTESDVSSLLTRRPEINFEIDQSGKASVEGITPRQLCRLVIKMGLTPEDLERELVYAALDQTGGDKVAAARLLKIGKSTLYRRLGADAARELDGNGR